MRAIHVAAGDLYGGIERMLGTLAATKSDALSQQFAVSPGGRLWRELQEAGADPVALPSARASRPLTVLTARRDFARTLSGLTLDAVILHGSWTHAVFAPAARARGVLVAFWQHQPITQPRWPDRWAARTAPDILIANSRFTGAAPTFARSRSLVIYCPVPPVPDIPAQQRLAGRAALGARDTDVVVLMAARLEPWKGHRILIEAAKLAATRHVKVWIAGGVQRPTERSYFDQLAAQISASGTHTSVSLLGEREDVPALMRMADIYCQPNLEPEPFGIAIAEAMRAGLPCIVSNTGGAAELVDAECGVFTAPGDAHGVAGAIARLAANAPLRGTMGCAAARRAARLTDPAERLAELAAALTVHPAAHAV